MTKPIRSFLASLLLASSLLLLPAVTAAQTPQNPVPPPPTGGASLELPPVELSPPEFLQAEDGGLTADEAAQRAVETAPQVRRARALQAQAGARADEALSSFVPRVDVSFGYSRINRITFPPFEFGGTVVDNPFPQILNLWALRGSVDIPLSDYFLVNLPAYDGAESFLDAAAATREVDEQAVAIRARIAYFDYVRARASLWVAQEATASYEATLQDTAALVQAGVSPRAEYAQIVAALSQSRAEEIQSQAAVNTAELVLRQMLHLDDDVEIGIGENLLTASTREMPTEAELIREAWDDRPDVRALESSVRARRALVASRTGATLPRVSLNGAIETSNPNPRVIPQADQFNTTWALSALVSWSPNDLGSGVHRIRQAEAQVEQIEAELEQLREGVEVQATTAVGDHRRVLASIEAFEGALVAAEVALNDRRALLAAGAGTSTEFVTAQLAHVRARQSLINASATRRSM